MEERFQKLTIFTSSILVSKSYWSLKWRSIGLGTHYFSSIALHCERSDPRTPLKSVYTSRNIESSSILYTLVGSTSNGVFDVRYEMG
jgi:hypothetical protein